jgi:hypothetical protein
LGPAGLFYDKEADALYVASTADNAIFKIPHAGTAGPSSGTGKLVFTDPNLLGALSLALAPTDPAHPSEIVEFTKTGHGEYNIHQKWGRSVRCCDIHTGGGQGHPNNDVDRLAVVNDNANDVAVTKFVLP